MNLYYQKFDKTQSSTVSNPKTRYSNVLRVLRIKVAYSCLTVTCVEQRVTCMFVTAGTLITGTTFTFLRLTVTYSISTVRSATLFLLTSIITCMCNIAFPQCNVCLEFPENILAKYYMVLLAEPENSRIMHCGKVWYMILILLGLVKS